MFLRRFARPLLAKVKETTGIVGLDVVPNAREVLISLYTKTLHEIKAVPEDEGYRKAVESFTRHRLKVCNEEEDWEAIEKRLGCGQVEELIEEAQDELTLIGKMIGLFNVHYLFDLFFFWFNIEILIRNVRNLGVLNVNWADQDPLLIAPKQVFGEDLLIEWEPWGVPDDYECEVIENDAPVPKHVPLHRPGPLPEEFFKTLEAVSSLPKKDEPATTSGESQTKE
ncbi:hypothetical protein Scep_006143 [Stephania cephalantha]|uniref:Uncharacterized protein n=1 Tax=Stephania cephalantha TaxID=152367 RepID=A0AAP0PNQ6_9MAGN